MDNTLVSELGIPTQPLSIHMDVRVLDGSSIGRVNDTTFPINPRVSGNHSESMEFLSIEFTHEPVVLGFSWLQRNNPLISWATGYILRWSPFCHVHCLRSALPALGHLKVIYHLHKQSLSAMMGSKTRLKRFIYILCLQEGKQFSKNFERHGRFDIADRLLYFLGQGVAFSREDLLLPLLVSLVHIRWIESRLLCST
jgi:hypothetical protein